MQGIRTASGIVLAAVLVLRRNDNNDSSSLPGATPTAGTIYAFGGASSPTPDGAAPYGPLMFDGAYLDGTTSAGGICGNGTVFAIPLRD